MGESFKQSSRDRDALALAAAQALPAIADQRLIAIGHFLDEVVGERRFRGGDHALARHVWMAVTDVIPDRFIEENRFLRDDGDLVAQRSQRNIAQIVAIDAHRAATLANKIGAED